MTKALIPVSTLADLLGRVTLLADERSTIEVLSCVRIEWNDGRLQIASTNTEAWLHEIAPAEVIGTWAGCIEAKRLLAIVKTLPRGDSVATLAAADDTLSVAAGDATARFLAIEVDAFPAVIAVRRDGEKITENVPATEIAAAIRCTLAALPDDRDARHYLRGAFFDAGHVAIATNGHRMGRCRVRIDVPDPGVIVPAPSLGMLAKLLRTVEVVSLTVTERTLTVTADAWTFVTKLIDGTYPLWRQVIPPRAAEPVLVNRAALLVAAERVEDIGSRAVTLTLSAGDLTGGDERAGAETVIAISGGPATAHSILSTEYLLDALGTIEGEDVDLYLDGDNAPVWISPVDENEDGTVIVPRRS